VADGGEPDAQLHLVIGTRPGPIGIGDLTAAYPWPDDGQWVRAMMVATLDGATAGGDGRSRSISSVTDRAVLAAVRRLSDVVLIGAGTFRAERYSPMQARPADAPARSAAGLAAAPVIAIVSRSLDLPWDEPVFRESAVRPLVVTTEAAHPDRLAAAQQHSDVVVLPGELVDLPAMFERFADRGLRRVVCEGGATLLATISRDRLLDEVDLSIAPLMIGGGQVVTGTASPVPQGFSLEQVIVGADGFLFTRYVSERSR
jgi:riboflavin-specific deaminase-like protein